MEIGVENKFITSLTENVFYIDNNGNVAFTQELNKFCLSIEENMREADSLKKVTKDYYYMSEIFDDCFIVSDVHCNQNLGYKDKYDDSRLTFKFGVIMLQRDEKGNIIPMAEKIVVPILYDDISMGNLKTIIAFVKDSCTYIDINPESENFGKQLVPTVLGHALPFAEKYEGFAECSVDGVSGYLPRNCQHKTSISKEELLTEEQVKCILTFLENEENIFDSELSNVFAGSVEKAK